METRLSWRVSKHHASSYTAVVVHLMLLESHYTQTSRLCHFDQEERTIVLICAPIKVVNIDCDFSLLMHI